MSIQSAYQPIIGAAGLLAYEGRSANISFSSTPTSCNIPQNQVDSSRACVNSAGCLTNEVCVCGASTVAGSCDTLLGLPLPGCVCSIITPAISISNTYPGGLLGYLANLADSVQFDYIGYFSHTAITVSVMPDICQASSDIGFLLDGSGSISDADWYTTKLFVASIVSSINLNSSAGASYSKVALYTFGDRVTELFQFANPYTSLTSLQCAISLAPRSGDGTSTQLAFNASINDMFTANYGMRPISIFLPKILILITDGLMDSVGGNLANTYAQALIASGVQIIVVGITLACDQTQSICLDQVTYICHRLHLYYYTNYQ